MRPCSIASVVLMMAASWGQADNAQVEVIKMPAKVVTRSFNPKHPPADMPPPEPPETAECDSDFLSNAAVGCQAQVIDKTHAKVKLNHIKVTLQLNITIWLPTNTFPKLTEHENGHRQISENYYKDAEKIARKIAEKYIDKEFDISGPDLRKAASAVLSKTAEEITNEYNKQMPVETTQARYDAINQHGENDVPADKAIAQAMKETFPDRKEAEGKSEARDLKAESKVNEE